MWHAQCEARVRSITSDCLVLGLFAAESDAREVLSAVRALGLGDQHFGILGPGQQLSMSQTTPDELSHMLARAASAPEVSAAHDLENLLIGLGVADARLASTPAKCATDAPW